VDSVKQILKIKEKKNIHQNDRILKLFQKTNALCFFAFNTNTLKIQ